MEKNFFKAEHICAGYGEREILHDISFALEPHTMTAVIGANGCGKTTLLRCVANQIRHTGECYLQDVGLDTLSVKKISREVSYIPQKGGVDIALPALEVVLMGYNPVLKLFEQPSKKQREEAMEALRIVGLEEAAEQNYLTLSEGQKQLVLLARTIVEHTKLLLLDEPDSALDFRNRYLIMRQLKKMLSEEEKAGLVCLHDPALALEFCEQLIVIQNGSCIGILHPKTDSIETMESTLRMIYKNISIQVCKDKQEQKHLVMLWEET